MKVILILLLSAASLFADSQVSHKLTIEIKPIYMLEVVEDGTYGVTVIGDNPDIYVTLLTDADVRLQMFSTIGHSLGWVRLEMDVRQPIVLDVHGNEFNLWEIETDETVNLLFELCEN